MLRDLLRTIGVACIISGIALYFITDNTSKNAGETSDSATLHEKIETLQLALQQTEEELATLQMTTSMKENQESSEADMDDSDQDSSSTQIIKTILTIKPGANSSFVSYELERMGILNSATEFENFLQSNELSGKIQIGEYELDSSMNFDQIAKIITSS